MTSWVDPEDGLRELLALGRAPTADALHRVLVLSRPVRQSTDTMEPLWLLRRIAETEPEEAFTTAFLLLTDRRWRKGVSQLVRRIEDSGCVDEGALDELAESFLTAERVLYWVVPDCWFGEEEIIVTDLDEAPATTATSTARPWTRMSRMTRMERASHDRCTRHCAGGRQHDWPHGAWPRSRR